MKRILTLFLALLMVGALCSTAHAQTDSPTFAVVDITEMDISALQQAVDDGYLTYEQITLLYLERIEAYADMYQCIISVSDTALEEARECDRIYRESGRSSLLFGLPAIVKDNIDVAGMATTNGDQDLADNIASDDATVIAALRNAGAIVVAKANMDAWASNAQYSISDYGRVNNAYDLNKTPYGSSGGSAVAAAASLAPICLGTDTNSSIRVPASGNGVVGIRPTTGLLSGNGVTPLVSERDTAGCMARSVFDTALILSAMTDFTQDYTAKLSPDALSGLRIGVVDNLVQHSTDEILAIFESAIAVLQEQGAEIVHVTMPLGTLSSDVPTVQASVVAAMDDYGLDLVIYPTIRSAVMTHEDALPGSNSNGLYLSPSAGIPALTVPMGTDSSGIPSGLEFAARPYDDELVFRAGYAFEQALGLTAKTSLAPSLYDTAPQSICDLFTLRDTSAYPVIEGFDGDYSAVAATYEAAVAYLSEPYYTHADAVERADALLGAYNDAVTTYCSEYQDLLDRLAAQESVRRQTLKIIAILTAATVLMFACLTASVRTEKKRRR